MVMDQRGGMKGPADTQPVYSSKSMGGALTFFPKTIVFVAYIVGLGSSPLLVIKGFWMASRHGSRAHAMSLPWHSRARSTGQQPGVPHGFL